MFGINLSKNVLPFQFLYPDNKKWNSKFMSVLKALIEEYEKDILLKHIGFLDDWQERMENH